MDESAQRELTAKTCSTSTSDPTAELTSARVTSLATPVGTPTGQSGEGDVRFVRAMIGATPSGSRGGRRLASGRQGNGTRRHKRRQVRAARLSGCQAVGLSAVSAGRGRMMMFVCLRACLLCVDASTSTSNESILAMYLYAARCI
jgi:hypothetical protein